MSSECKIPVSFNFTPTLRNLKKRDIAASGESGKRYYISFFVGEK
jgi:hypothetical protein